MLAPRSFIQLLFLVSLCVGLVFSVAYDAACDTSLTDACTGTNANTFCQKHDDVTATCTKGTCKCQAGYDWDSSASKCKLRKYYLDKCNTANDACQTGTTCTSGTAGSQCKCPSGEAFNTVVGKCVTVSLMGIGEKCSAVAGCYVEHAGSVSCTTTTGATQAVCTCVSPYRQHAGSCRKPYIGEACTSVVGCTREISVTDTSFATESCVGSLCACPTSPSSAKHTITDHLQTGLVYDVCLVSPTTQSAFGASCTATNQCATKLCLQCPESSSKSCVAAPTE